MRREPPLTPRARLYYGIEQYDYAYKATLGVPNVAMNSIANSGPLGVEASAVANATSGKASAEAYNDYGLNQYAYGYLNADAVNKITNSGTITIGADASANGGTVGYAYATNYKPFYQSAYQTGLGTASNTVTNGGSIDLHAVAKAAGTVATAYARAEYGVSQDAYAESGTLASDIIKSSGTIDVHATADAVASKGGALATAIVTSAIWQGAFAPSGVAVASMTNSGALTAAAHAHATGGTAAFAFADVYHPVTQSATGTSATVSFTNSGTINITADAKAVAASGKATALALIGASTPLGSGAAFYQNATGSVVTFDNSGTIDVAAVAHATGTVSALAGAIAPGLSQNANGGTETFINEAGGTYSVLASASAHAVTSANRDRTRDRGRSACRGRRYELHQQREVQRQRRGACRGFERNSRSLRERLWRQPDGRVAHGERSERRHDDGCGRRSGAELRGCDRGRHLR